MASTEVSRVLEYLHTNTKPEPDATLSTCSTDLQSSSYNDRQTAWDGINGHPFLLSSNSKSLDLVLCSPKLLIQLNSLEDSWALKQSQYLGTDKHVLIRHNLIGAFDGARKHLTQYCIPNDDSLINLSGATSMIVYLRKVCYPRR